MLPSLFVAHGAPTLVTDRLRYTGFLQTLGQKLPKPRAIVLFSAHWEAAVQQIGSAVRYTTIHDFFGFPDALYEIEYRAQGDIALALQIRELLEKEGVAAELDDRRGLDHGAWSVLKLMYPQADVPVVSMSVHAGLVPEQQYRIGRALAALRKQDVLIMGSGGTVHNLNRLAWDSGDVSAWALEFDEWLGERIETWDIDRLFRYDAEAPFAKEAVPRSEHFVPLLIAMGAAHEGKKAKLLHRQYQYGSLSLSCWMFG
ncbi:class III extradiol ring-cleavage dioxygenase [Paenibacillus validus]|uniref:Dioxygenase n=1 Tax=Paenibacillus validus TaxID=44253 RepID=A0A7X3CUY0_9BACL|nr:MULTISPECIES: class III extradiol ring-cleavage dioxygenase [Paenibacillus]MED4603443.1 class III extradiol ring-cleavage dioxygenase [Paenibacillus validus]MED4609243.1 class III extradiol ring-cleavage dioxygenase [Paenibacillus validus]MUG73166.1 dioxygenase [Paenibacillus validus]